MKRCNLELELSGLKQVDVDFICRVLKNNGYSYDHTVEEYDDTPEEWKHMTMFAYIKNMNIGDMEKFIYWVYSCGNQDGRDGREDSPGDCSFFGGRMLSMNVADVVDLISDFDSRGFSWLQ